MTKWRLQTLGKLALTRMGETGEMEAESLPTGGFRNKRTWILLASLVTDPRVCHRQELARRLWEETEFEDEPACRTRLRPILSDLIHGDKAKGFTGLGEHSLLCDRETVQIKPGVVVTDVQEAEALFRDAKALEEGAVRIGPLRATARLLQGTFLPGFQPPQAAFTWYHIQLLHLERLRYEVWEQLFHTAGNCGDTVTAAEAWQQLQGIEVPADINVGIKELISFSRLSPPGTDSSEDILPCKTRPSGSKAPVAWGDFLPHLEKKEQNGFSLSVREEKALLESLDTTLSALPRQSAIALRLLSIFPQSFTQRQAAAIVGIPCPVTLGKTIRCLVKAALLRKVPCGEMESGTGFSIEERFALPPFAQPLLWQNLSSVQRKRLRARHARYFAAFNGQGWPDTGDSLVDNERVRRWAGEEEANALQALDTCLEAALTEETMEFLASLCRSVGLSASDSAPLLYRSILRQATPRLTEAAESGGFFSHCPAVVLCQAAWEEHDFTAMTHWANAALDWVKTHRNQPVIAGDPGGLALALGHRLQHLLQATHHAGRHEDFDRAREIAWSLLPEMNGSGGTDADDVRLARLQFRYSIQYNAAENYWTRGDLESAFTASDGAMADMKQIVTHQPFHERQFAETYYQRGCIQWERGHRDDALAAWNEALDRFGEMNDAHGIADCKKRLGKALAEMGQFALGQDLVREAITLYAALENEASRTAALGTLADVLVMRGKTEEARRYYEEGLAYWRTTGHESWIRRFETALAQL